MNLKRVFGGLLTLLGIGGLLYAAITAATQSGEAMDLKQLIIFGVVGLIFFISGISLIRTTKDEV